MPKTGHPLFIVMAEKHFIPWWNVAFFDVSVGIEGALHHDTLTEQRGAKF